MVWPVPLTYLVSYLPNTCIQKCSGYKRVTYDLGSQLLRWSPLILLVFTPLVSTVWPRENEGGAGPSLGICLCFSQAICLWEASCHYEQLYGEVHAVRKWGFLGQLSKPGSLPSPHPRSWLTDWQQPQARSSQTSQIPGPQEWNMKYCFILLNLGVIFYAAWITNTYSSPSEFKIYFFIFCKVTYI